MDTKRYEVVDASGRRAVLKLSDEDAKAIVERGGTATPVGGTDAGAPTKKRAATTTRTK